MADKKAPGRPFEKGKSGNPAGRAPMSEELKRFKKLNKTAFEEAVHKLSSMNKVELKRYFEEGDEKGMPSVLEHMLLGQINAAMKGKTQPIAFLCDRTIGPLKHQFAVQVDASIAKELADMTEEEKDLLATELEGRLKGTIGSQE